MPAPLVLPAPSPPAPTTTQGSTFSVKCGYWSWSHGDIYENVVLIVAELGYKDVPRRHWRTRVLNFCKENQIPVGPSDLMVMYEYGNFLRWG